METRYLKWKQSESEFNSCFCHFCWLVGVKNISLGNYFSWALNLRKPHGHYIYIIHIEGSSSSTHAQDGAIKSGVNYIVSLMSRDVILPSHPWWLCYIPIKLYNIELLLSWSSNTHLSFICSIMAFIFGEFYCSVCKRGNNYWNHGVSSFQADLTKERVVSREQGEQLAKVCMLKYSWLFN